MRRSRARPAVPLLRGMALALAALTACAQKLSVDVRIGRPPPVPAQASPNPTPLGVTLTRAGAIEFDRVQLVIRDLRLESSATVGDAASPGRQVVLIGPRLIELSDDQLRMGALTRLLSGAHGGLNSFYELDLDLRPVSEAEAILAPELTPLVGQSLAVSGRYGGKPFVFTSKLTAVLKSEAVFRFGTNQNNVDLDFDPELWFLDASGAALDPTDPANRETIEQNLVRTFTAYEDDDFDGLPDSLD